MVPGSPKIEFVLEDIIDGVSMSPSSIDLSRFHKFNQDVVRFVSGSQRLSLEGVRVQITNGSYRLIVMPTVLIATAIEPDLVRLGEQHALGEIDPARAEVMQAWQSESRERECLRISILPVGLAAGRIEVSRKSDFRIFRDETWVKVERYEFATVIDMGGAKKATVTVRFDGSNNLVVLGATQDYLKEQHDNLLYKKALVHFHAEMNTRTGKLRAPELIAFADYGSRYDPAALDKFEEEGRKAWADVSDPAAWVREIRGGA